MYITLWQQFSSHHNDVYTFGGKFATVELAQQAADG